MRSVLHVLRNLPEANVSPDNLRIMPYGSTHPAAASSLPVSDSSNLWRLIQYTFI